MRAYCYERAPGQFVAECIDLDLLSQGSTPEEAIGTLQEAMVDYLQAAFAGGDARGLVPRLSPRSHRLRYHWTRALARVSERMHGRHKHLLYRPVISGESTSPTIRLAHC